MSVTAPKVDHEQAFNHEMASAIEQLTDCAKWVDQARQDAKDGKQQSATADLIACCDKLTATINTMTNAMANLSARG